MSDSKQKSKVDTTVIPGYAKFIIGGMSGMSASTIVQPMDIMKTRLQISAIGKGTKYNGLWDCFKTMLRTEGVLGFYAGLSAALVRQATYTGSRLGIFSLISEKYRKHVGEPSIYSRLTIGTISGALAAIVGTPADLVLIRMTADGRSPPELRRNYKHVFDAFIRISREEGVPALWRGTLATMGRAMVVNMVQLGSYSQIKSMLINNYKFNDGLKTHFCSSMASGFLVVVASMPFDMAKTRIQDMRVVNNKPEYRGIIDVLVKVVRNEGFFKLWTGFVPYWNRLGPHTVFTFMFMEQFSILYYKFILGVDYKSSDV